MRLQSLAPLLHKEYRYFVYMRFFYTMALRMVATVVAYKLFLLTKSSFSIGLVGLAEFLPVITLALYAGHIIDRSDKRTLLLKWVCGYSLCVVALIFLTGSDVERKMDTGIIEVMFYVIIFFTGVIRAFAQPAYNAIIVQLVPRGILHLSSNIGSSTFLTASIAGHASAGFFIAWVGVHNTFYIIFLYALMAVFFTSRISRKPVLNTNRLKTWASMKEGLNFVFRNKVLLSAITLDLFAVFFGGAVALLPEFATSILKVGPIGFGWLNASVDLGSVVIILMITIFPIRKKQGLIQIGVIAGFGFCMIAFGISAVYWFSFFVLFVAGMFDGINVVVRGNIFQLTTPDEMRGRVSAVNSIFVNSSNELGQFESGFAAKIMGTVPSVIFGGGMTLVVVLITWIKARDLRKFEY